MVGEVRNGVVDSIRVLSSLQILLVELEVATEDLFANPEVTVGEEEVTIHFLGDLSTVLDRAAHFLHSFPLVLSVGESTLGEMLLHVKERGL
jgi:chloramphenicol 3-O-phosphotransferase